jgi:hypothetical protein
VPADRHFTVSIYDDATLEEEEVLTLELRAPGGGATLDPQNRMTVLKSWTTTAHSSWPPPR